MLLEFGVTGSLVGHSERRQYFGESDETVGLRVRGALTAGLQVVACVGETIEERRGGETENVLRRQLSVLEPHRTLVLAYAPVGESRRPGRATRSSLRTLRSSTGSGTTTRTPSSTPRVRPSAYRTVRWAIPRWDTSRSARAASCSRISCV